MVAYRESTALRRASTKVRIDLSQKPAPFSEPASKLHAWAGCARDKPLAIVEVVAFDETQRSTGMNHSLLCTKLRLPDRAQETDFSVR